jgi:serine protease Do
MKQFIKKLSLTLLAPAFIATSLMAQKEDKDKEDKEKKEAEQIIITRKGDKDDKIVVELKGDKVIVNGKELKEDDEDGDVTVRRRKIKDVWAFDGDGFTGTMNEPGHFKMYNVNENKAMLGVTTDEVENGVEIQSITKQSAAEKAGLKEGDIITRVNDRKIESPDDLSDAIQDHKPGEKVTITYLRDKKEQKVTAELGKWKGVSGFSYGDGYNLQLEGLKDQLRTMPRGNYNYNWNWSGNGPKLGISVQDTENGKGVNVIDVDEDGNAAKAGIKEEDIITDVDGKAVNGADEIAKLIKESKDKSSVKVKLLRNGKPMTVDVKIPKKLKSADL